jgi:CubicO group peptidase (beta-lactamase class C family)
VNDIELDKLIRESTARHGVSACAAVVSGPRSQAAAAVGVQENGSPATVDTRFQAGSTTKALTAALVIDICADRGIDLATPVVDALPELALPAPSNAATVRDLLAHTSGIDNGAYQPTGTGDDAIARYASLIPSWLPIHEPGAMFGYSNAAYTAAGLLVERLAKEPFEDALRERLLEPLAMTRSIAALSAPPEDVITPPTSLAWDVGGGRGQAPAGGTLYSTARDLHTFVCSLIDESTTALRREPAVAVPYGRFVNAWGPGLMLSDWDGTEVVGHDGGNAHGMSRVRAIPSLGIAFAVMATAHRDAFFVFDDVAAAVASEAGLTVPDHPAPLDDPTIPDPARYVGTYRHLWGTHTIALGENGELSVRSQIPFEGLDQRGRLFPAGENVFVLDGSVGSPPGLYSAEFLDGADRMSHLRNWVFAASRVD